MWGEWVKEGTAWCLLDYFHRRKLSKHSYEMFDWADEMGKASGEDRREIVPPLLLQNRAPGIRPYSYDPSFNCYWLIGLGQTCTRIYINKMRRKQYLPCRVTINLEIMYTKCFKCVLCMVTQILVTHNYYIWWLITIISGGRQWSEKPRNINREAWLKTECPLHR